MAATVVFVVAEIIGASLASGQTPTPPAASTATRTRTPTSRGRIPLHARAVADPAAARTGQTVQLDAVDRSGRIVSSATWSQTAGEPLVELRPVGTFGASFRAPWVAEATSIHLQMVLHGAGGFGVNGPPINSFVSGVSVTLLGGGSSPTPTDTRRPTDSPTPSVTNTPPATPECEFAVEPAALRLDDCHPDDAVAGIVSVSARDEECCWVIRGPSGLLTFDPSEGCGAADISFAGPTVGGLPRRLSYLFLRDAASQVSETGFFIFRDGCPTPTRTPIPTRTLTSLPTATPSPSATHTVRAGDCDGDGFVRIHELVAVIRRAICLVCLPDEPILCAADIDGNGHISVNEVIAVINNALVG